MNRLFILIGVLVLATAGVFLFLTFSPAQKKSPAEVTGPITSSFNAITTQGGDSKCTWEDHESGAITKGTVYISGKNFKAVSQTSTGDFSLNTYFLGIGEKLYAWSDLDSANGSIIDYKTFKNPADKKSMYSTEKTYVCTPWAPDPTVFEVPKNMSFK